MGAVLLLPPSPPQANKPSNSTSIGCTGIGETCKPGLLRLGCLLLRLGCLVAWLLVCLCACLLACSLACLLACLACLLAC